MLKKIAVAAVIGGAVLGAGTAALAASGGSTPAPSTSAAAGKTATHHKHHHAGLDIARHSAHATWVTDGKKGVVTHDSINGTVTAVSATSITVKAKDGVSQTYAVGSSTGVKVRTDGKGAKGTISEIKTGDEAIVIGTGTSTLSAVHIIDGVKR